MPAHDTLLAIARAVGGAADTTEALRLVSGELSRATGADTVRAFVRDAKERLRLVAGHGVPEDAIDTPVTPPAGLVSVMEAAEIAWTDDVERDPRFAGQPFEPAPHRSAVVIPLVVGGDFTGALYLAWRAAARRLEPSEAVVLEIVGQHVGLYLRHAWLVAEAEIRRRVAEAAKEHYQLLFDRNLAGVFRSVGDGRIVECNQAFARLLGYRTPADAIGRTVWDFSADADGRAALLDRLARDGRVANHEMAWRRVSGEPFTALMNATQLGLGAGAHVEGIVLDVSDRRRAEDALRERETQLRNLGDNLPGGVIYQVVRRPDGSNYFPYMSSGLESVFGVRAIDAMADATLVYRLVVPEDLALIRAAADDSIQTGQPIDVEYRMRTPSGELRWMNLRGRPRPLPDGATVWDVVALDVTERRHAQGVLERYRLLFERSLVGLFRTRPDGILLDCNDAFARILGYERAEDVRGRSVLEHYAEEGDRDRLVAKIASGENVVDAELTARRRDGALVPVAMSVRRIVDDDGPVHEGTLVDLTDRKRAEETAALRSVAELANAAAHEINNPLAVIAGQLALMDERGVDGKRTEPARRAVFRIRDIVDHMVRITRLESATDQSAQLPRMLDIRRSGPPPDERGA